jgi:exonuclease SbcD
MSRVAFLFRTDTHVADRSPMSWKGDYPAEIWSNLEQIGKLAKEHEVSAVLDGGDFFHVKAASKNPHALVVKAARIHRAYPCPTFCVEGNHDIAYNNLETVEKQPLGVLYESGVFQHLREHTFKDGKIRVRVVGVPYSPVRKLSELLAIHKKPGDTFLIAVVHSLASMSPPAQVEDFFNEPVFRYEDLISRNGPDVWCFGHWHRDQGIEQIQGRFFVNQGALSRGALVRENLERIPKGALLEFTESGVRIEPLLMIVAPASEVFDLERKETQERERRDIDQFITRLVEDASFDPNESIHQNIRSMGFAEEVRDEALRYLELAETEVG